MSRITDPEYNRAVQYRDASRLNTRAGLHERFGRNPVAWLHWLFEQMNVPQGARVLECGCGTGALWTQNAARLPEGLEAVLTDLSVGMLNTCAQNLVGWQGFSFATCSVLALPFPDGSFNRVTANHMLYHVSDVGKAAAEMARVMMPGGVLTAATNGLTNMQEMHDLVVEVAGLKDWQPPVVVFALENAPKLLGESFRDIEVVRYSDELWVTEVEPLVKYIVSAASYFMVEANERFIHELEEKISRRIAAEGGFHIRKDTGMVKAVRR